MRTLICDDDARMRRLYRSGFELAGVDVIEASNGPECVELVQRDHPDLVVLDLNMPRGGGLSALPQLREHHRDIPVIVVTAHAGAEVFDRSRKLGATACFTKPGFLARIPEVVERYSLTA